MSKRLILILTLAFVVGIAFAAYAEVQNVKVSGDLNVLGISRDLDFKHGKNGSTNVDRESGIASITRVRVDADLTDNVMTTVRLLNERYWGREVDNVATGTVSTTLSDNNTDISLDLANVTLKEFLYSPLSLTVGRQELMIGSGMILGDPDTNNAVSTASAFATTNGDRDLSARKAFDAIRATLDYDPLVIDVLYAKINANNSKNAVKDDEDLYGINANYKVNKETTVEGYMYEKRIGKNRNAAGLANKVQRTDVIGGRVINTSLKDLLLSLEAAYQFGKYYDSTADAIQPRHAWALEAGANYNFSKVKYTPSVTALYAYFSGDNAGPSGTQGNRGWDPMYENQKYGDIANAQFNQTNAHILGGIATAKLKDDITLKGEYYAYWWAKPYTDGQSISTVRGDTLIMKQRRFAGQEIDLTGTYDYTEDVSFSLMGGWFLPGSSFAKYSGVSGSSSTVKQNKIASEVIGSMKVTF